MTKTLLMVCAFGCCIAVGVIGAVTIFTNPDMSGTRLLIEHWPRSMTMIGFSITAVWLARLADRR